jgi:beta-alanine--pyruvate transaminase
MTLAKATTNGVVPMGVVAIRDGIYDAVIDSAPEGAIELFHGYTYSGIPAAVAAALAVQDIFEKENIFNKVKEISPYFQEALHSLKDLECVENIRGYGLLGGVDIKKKDRPGKAGFQVYKSCYENGVNFKATGDALVLAPPFISEKKHIDEIFDKIRKGINQYMRH